MSHLAVETKRGRGEGVARGGGFGGGPKRGLKLELWDEVRLGKRKRVATWGGSPERESRGDAACDWVTAVVGQERHQRCFPRGVSPVTATEPRGRAAEAAVCSSLAGRKARPSWLAMARGAGSPPNREAKYLSQGSDRHRFAAGGVKKRTW